MLPTRDQKINECMKKAILLAILLATFLNLALTAQRLDMEFGRSHKRIDIPFNYVNGFIIVNVTFNDFLPLQFIFDTGAEYTILSKREITDMLRIDYQRRLPIMGADLSTELYAYLVHGINLQLGDIKAVNRSILVLEEDYFHFEEYTGVSVQGILGSDFFRRFIVKIDYRKGAISLYDPQYFTPPDRGFSELPIEVERGKPFLRAAVHFHPDTAIQVRLLMDTGAGLALLLHTDTHPGLKLPERVIPSNLGAGLGGFLQGYMGRIQKLDAGPFTFNEVTAQFQKLPEGLDTARLSFNRNGIIGNEVLGRFTLIIDYINARAYVEPNRFFKDKFTHDRSGLLIAAGGVQLNEFIIYGVVPGSPAYQAGLRLGDQMLSINGLPASFLTLASISRKLRKREGKRINLRIERGDTRLRFSFRLRELI